MSVIIFPYILLYFVRYNFLFFSLSIVQGEILQNGWQEQCRYNVIPPCHLELHPLTVWHPPWWLRLQCHQQAAWAAAESICQDSYVFPRESDASRLRCIHAWFQSLRKGVLHLYYTLITELHSDSSSIDTPQCCFCFSCVFWQLQCLQCFDAVGWATGRASGL